jgi:hypothetical protein
MQIQLKQPELEAAVRAYIELSGILRPIGAISFTASRGTDGMVTEIEVLDVTQEGTTGSRPVVSESKPKRGEKLKAVSKAKEPEEAAAAEPNLVEAIIEESAPAPTDSESETNPSGKSLFG